MEFLILTAARTGEVLGARWSEIDIPTRVWTVPASRMKAHRNTGCRYPIERLRSCERPASAVSANSSFLVRSKARLGQAAAQLNRDRPLLKWRS